MQGEQGSQTTARLALVDYRLRRPLVALLGMLALLLGTTLCAVATPGYAQAKKTRAKTSTTLKLATPASGGASFLHARAKLPGTSRGRTRVRFRIRNRKRLAKSLLVYAQTAKLRKGRGKRSLRNQYGLELLVVNSTKAAARTAGEVAERPVRVVVTARHNGRRQRMTVKRTDSTDDLLGTDESPAYCDSTRNASPKAVRLFGPRVSGVSSARAMLWGDYFFCDQPEGFTKDLDPIVVTGSLGVTAPPSGSGPSCGGTLAPAAGGGLVGGPGIKITFTCGAPTSSAGFELPATRSIVNYTPPSSLPTCEPEDADGGTKNRLVCGGAIAAGVENVVTIQTNTAPGCSDTVRIYRNPLGAAAPAITDTNAFATCP